MQITADIMISKNNQPKWSQIKAHVDRSNSNYSNKNINQTWTHDNLEGTIHNVHELDNRAYGRYVALLRKKAKSQGNLKRAAKNGYDFATHGRRSNQRLMILELGNHRSRARYFADMEKHGLSKDRIRQSESYALVQTAKQFDRTHKHLKIGAFSTNVDESTAHIHCQLIALPSHGKRKTNMATRQQKKQGVKVPYYRPSLSFNKALCEDFPNARNKANQPSSRGAMKQLRQSFDKKIVQNFDRTVARYDDVNLNLHLGRTNEVNHLSLAEYQAKKDVQRAKSAAQSAKHNKAKYTSSLASRVYSSAIPVLTRVSAQYSQSASKKFQRQGSSFVSTFIKSQKADYASNARSFIRAEKSSASQKISSAESHYSASASDSASTAIEPEKRSVSSASSSLENLHNNIRNPIDSFACSYQNGGLDKRSWNKMTDSRAIDNLADIANDMNKKTERINDNKKEMKKFNIQQLIILAPNFTKLSKPMQLSMCYYYKKDGSGLDPDKLSHPKFYEIPSFRISDGKNSYRGLGAITYLASYDIQNRLNQSKVQQVATNESDFQKNIDSDSEPDGPE